MGTTYDYTIVGGGIIGLATANELLDRAPGSSLVLIEKESDWAQHQSGRNSGVIHAGVYYAPGSAKARMATAGKESIVRFAARHGIPHEICGKLIVATSEEQRAPLEALYGRARQNGVPVEMLSAAQGKEVEPNVRLVAAISSPTTGIIDYGAVCRILAQLVMDRGADMRLDTEMLATVRNGSERVVETNRGEIRTRFLVTCGGLQSDRIVARSGSEPPARIVPFRGEYYQLIPSRRHLINHLVYPVPDPALPFLGVHFTRMTDGNVHAGPNAVLAFKREGYSRTDLSLRDLGDTLGYGGFWRLARRYWRHGAGEMARSAFKGAFVRSLQELLPDITGDDLESAPAGVRAQAVRPDGSIIDDFLFVDGPNALHVVNAPSPAATASLEIASAIVDRVLESNG
jgi:L-2-hydroxyglutarate oxidase